MGLSPRVRGNLTQEPLRQRQVRSIPACAGEPPASPRSAWASTVYPRVCGGTVGPHGPAKQQWGLSPRVRGNLIQFAFVLVYGRSIPACAGEPGADSVGPGDLLVYPRVCGGTQRVPSSAASYPGLSPRVRGNPSAAVKRNAGRGSIPACAGEPSCPRRARALRRVYPRVCGGTLRTAMLNARRHGLSPRVRGNRPGPQ